MTAQSERARKAVTAPSTAQIGRNNAHPGQPLGDETERAVVRGDPVNGEYNLRADGLPHADGEISPVYGDVHKRR
ncbi:hypothetical protein [Microcella sp.]|uniref:hypothetical protein n=1 Tax=Microcella sp. TaxID=1913979 RepID=UPI00391A0F22